jgi:hypothetical protein
MTPDLAKVLVEIAQALAVASFLVLAVNRFVDAAITPFFDKYKWDKFWIKYLSWVLGGGLVFAAQLNLLAGLVPNQTLGLILTAIVAGGGPTLLHDIFNPNITPGQPKDKPGQYLAGYADGVKSVDIGPDYNNKNGPVQASVAKPGGG